MQLSQGQAFPCRYIPVSVARSSSCGCLHQICQGPCNTASTWLQELPVLWSPESWDVQLCYHVQMVQDFLRVFMRIPHCSILKLLCSQIEAYQYFRGMYCFHLKGQRVSQPSITRMQAELTTLCQIQLKHPLLDQIMFWDKI
jgi:hypothetical protein